MGGYMPHKALQYMLKFDDSLGNIYATNTYMELYNLKGECQGTNSLRNSPMAEKLIKAILLLGHSDSLNEIITACIKAAQAVQAE